MHLPDSILSKIFKAEELQQELSQKRPGQKVVFTNGCFDIIHLGHLHLLSSAREMGDLLVVGLNTDDSVKRLKGNDRPVKDQETRALVLASMEFVDYVVLFDEDTPMELIRTLGPDVLVKGGD